MSFMGSLTFKFKGDGFDAKYNRLDPKVVISEIAKLTGESPLFACRTKRGESPIHSEKINEMIHSIAKKS